MLFTFESIYFLINFIFYGLQFQPPKKEIHNGGALTDNEDNTKLSIDGLSDFQDDPEDVSSKYIYDLKIVLLNTNCVLAVWLGISSILIFRMFVSIPPGRTIFTNMLIYFSKFPREQKTSKNN